MAAEAERHSAEDMVEVHLSAEVMVVAERNAEAIAEAVVNAEAMEAEAAIKIVIKEAVVVTVRAAAIRTAIRVAVATKIVIKAVAADTDRLAVAEAIATAIKAGADIDRLAVAEAIVIAIKAAEAVDTKIVIKAEAVATSKADHLADQADSIRIVRALMRIAVIALFRIPVFRMKTNRNLVFWSKKSRLLDGSFDFKMFLSRKSRPLDGSFVRCSYSYESFVVLLTTTTND